MPRNEGELERGGAAPGQQGENSRRAMQDQEQKGGAERRRLQDALENERERLTRK